MQEVGVTPDRTTFVCMTLKCCCKCKKAFEKGSLIYNEIRKSSVKIDNSRGNVLISMFSQCGFLEEIAKTILDKMPNIVSRGGLISASCNYPRWPFLVCFYFV